MQKKNEIIDYIKENKLFPKKELQKVIYRISTLNTNDNAFENLVLSFDLFANKKNKSYFQEFLTIKKEEEQDIFIEKYSGIKGLLNKNLENKGELALSIAKRSSTAFIAKTFAVSAATLSAPSAVIGLAVILRASAPLAIKYISNNYNTNNPTVEHIDKRIKSIVKNYENNNYNAYTTEDKNKINAFFKLIPESQYFNHNRKLKDKIEYFYKAKDILKCTDRYIKNFLKQQEPELTFFYVNEIIKEINKHGLDLKKVLKASENYTNKGFVSLQAQVFDKIFKQDNMLNMLLKIKEDETELGTEFIDDLISVVDKMYSPNKVYKSFKIITDPKDFTKDLISSSIEKKIDSYTEEYRKEVIAWVNSPMEKIDNLETRLLKNKSEGVVGISNFITGKVHALNQKVVKQITDSPEKVSEILSEHLIDIEKDLERVKKLGENWKNPGNIWMKRQVADFIIFLEKNISVIKKCKDDFLNKHTTLKNCIDKITATLSSIWKKYEEVKKVCKEKTIMGLQHSGAFIVRTNSKFEKQFSGHEIMNHQDKLTPSIKSQLADIRKKANRFANNTDMVNNIKKSLGTP